MNTTIAKLRAYATHVARTVCPTVTRVSSQFLSKEDCEPGAVCGAGVAKIHGCECAVEENSHAHIGVGDTERRALHDLIRDLEADAARIHAPVSL